MESTDDEQKFTAYERDDEAGLDNAQARYYSSPYGPLPVPSALEWKPLQPYEICVEPNCQTTASFAASKFRVIRTLLQGYRKFGGESHRSDEGGRGMSITVLSQGKPQKERIPFIAAIILVLAGAAILCLTDSFVYRTLAVIAFVASARLVRMSIQSQSGPFGSQAVGRKSKGPGRLLWSASIAMVVLAGFSLFFLYKNALYGYHEAWPLKLFAGAAIACALVWSYLAYKLAR